MKYYLGYYDNLDYRPIELEGIDTSILSVIEFTTKFDNLNSLKKYLLAEHKIPNINVTLNYLIEKGPKGNKYYETLKTNRIYTIESSFLFTLDGIKKFILENKYQEDMIILLFAEYLKKMGYSKTIKESLKNKSQNATLIIPILKEIRKVTSTTIQEQINYIIDNYSKLTRDELANRIDYLISAFNYSNSDLVNTYLKLRPTLNFKNIPVINYIRNWFSIAHDHNEAGSAYYYEIPSEYRDINFEVNSFISAIVYDYDSIKKDYKKVNGKRKIQERPLFDLAVILEPYYKMKYDRYLNTIYREEEDSFDEDAEFLDESDFARYGTTSEEEGIKIRKRNR